MVIQISVRAFTYLYSAIIIVALSAVVAFSDEAQQLGSSTERTNNGIHSVILRAVASKGGPAGPTTNFSEFDESITIESKNTSQRHVITEFDIRIVDAPGYEAGTFIYKNRKRITLSPGEQGTMTLTMGESLSPGRFDLVIFRAGIEKSSIPITISSQYPLAEALSEEDEAALGPNLALAGLGARVQAPTEWNEQWAAEHIIDGVNFIRVPNTSRECINCGWSSAEGEALSQVTIDLAGGRPAEISHVTVDTRFFVRNGKERDARSWLPKSVAISVAGDDQEFKRIATARLQRDFLRQSINLPEGTRAQTVRVDILETFGDTGFAALAEIEVRESPDTATSIVSELELDIARSALGGAVVRYSSHAKDRPAARLFDGLPTAWVSRDEYFPQDFTIAFNGDRRAYIDRVELVMHENAEYSDQWPSEVAVALSDHPIDGFVEAVRVPIEQRSGVHPIPIDRAARFLKVRLLDNHGAQVTILGDIRVIEGRNFPSVVASEGTRAEAGADGLASKTVDPDLTETELNDTRETANPLELTQSLEGRIDPLGEVDMFRLPEFSPEVTALTIDYTGIPYIRHRLALLDSGGNVLSRFDPHDLTSERTRLTFALTGQETFLELSEPQASVVVIWDTSGSMSGREADLKQALSDYIQRAPKSQRVQLVAFNSEVRVLGQGFTADKDELQRIIGGNVGAEGGTALYDAIIRGVELLAGEAGNRAIVLMTDGNDTSSTWSGAVWEALERSQVRLYTVGLGNGLTEYSYELASTGQRLLSHVAEGTNGRSFFASQSTALHDFYTRINAELATPATYLITPEQEIGEGLLQVVAVGEQVPSAALPSVHVIFDVSGSMSKKLPSGGSRIDAAKAAMFNTLDNLPSGAPFALTVYGARIPEQPDKTLACTDIETVQKLAPLDKTSMKRFIGDLRPRGGTTPLARSIGQVVKGFNGENGGIIVAITDGIEECDEDPITAVNALKANGLDQVELNVIGFDLREATSKDMMEQIAGIGGGKFFDASDGDAVAVALTTAIAARFQAVDATGMVMASGHIGGSPQKLPPGWYTIEIATSDGARRISEVRINADRLTTVEVNKVGSEMDMGALEPRLYDPLAECGELAERAGDQGRVRRIQKKLNALGFDVGPPDGKVGPDTRHSMNLFIKAQRIDIEPETTLLFEQHLDCVISQSLPYADDAK